MTTLSQDIRPSPLAGSWYPADAARLAAQVDGFLAQAVPEAPSGTIVGLLVPHAGLVYSGPVAAYAFKLAAALTPEVVAVIGPSHRYAPAPLLTTGHDAYRTPLGTVPVAQTRWPRSASASTCTRSATTRSTPWRLSCPSSSAS